MSLTVQNETDQWCYPFENSSNKSPANKINLKTLKPFTNAGCLPWDSGMVHCVARWCLPTYLLQEQMGFPSLSLMCSDCTVYEVHRAMVALSWARPCSAEWGLAWAGSYGPLFRSLIPRLSHTQTKIWRKAGLGPGNKATILDFAN